MTEFKAWYMSKPVVTRTYLTGAFLLACLVSLKIVSPFLMFFTFNQAVLEFEIWRFLTALFFQGKFSFGFIFSMYFCYFALSKNENDTFQNRFPDFLWLCVCMYTVLIVLASLFPLYVFGDAFVFAFLYIWCKRRPFETIRLMFGFAVKSKSILTLGGYFPWVYMAFQILLGASFIIYVIGLLLGHLYITIKDIYLPRYHKDYLPTPQFL